MSIEFLRELSPVISPSSSRRSSNSSSTSRPPRPSASPSRPHYWHGRIRSSS